MAMPVAVDLFIPHLFLSKRSFNLIFGCTKVVDKHVHVCCVSLCELNPKSLELTASILQRANSSKSSIGQSRAIGVIAFENATESFKNYERKIREIIQQTSDLIWFEMNVFKTKPEIRISNVVSQGERLLTKQLRVIIFSATDFLNSHFLMHGEKSKLKDSFVGHIVTSFKDISTSCTDFEEETDFSVPFVLQTNHVVFSIMKNVVHFLCFYLCLMTTVCCRLTIWFPAMIKKFLLQSFLCQQLCQRVKHINSIALDLQDKKLTLRSQSILSASILDICCGVLAAYFFGHYLASEDFLMKIMGLTSNLVNFLESLINWLMGDPAGLKLNIPLNTVIGQLFLYHIHLWKTYITVIHPIFSFCLSSLPFLGLFGATFLLSGFNDLISLVTIHIYCYYGYMARFHHYHLRCVLALWRLFRGKKWNPETQRVESHTFDIHQLYIGTLLFTTLVFLLPTVMVYYLVFALLRLAVLVVQGVISKLTNILTIFPLYVILLRIFNSRLTAGEVCFSVKQWSDVLVLSLEVVQLPMCSVIRLTVPTLQQFGEVLSWKEFLSCLVRGKIIYPI